MRSPSGRCLPSTVALYNYVPTQDEDGGIVFNLATAQAVDLAAPCSVQLDETSRDYGEGQSRVSQVNTYTVYFDRDYGLNIKDVIVWIDGSITHTLYVIGQINLVGRSAVWSIKAREII